jgi:hypothetical protein
MSCIVADTAGANQPWQLPLVLQLSHSCWVMSINLSAGMPEHRAMDSSAPDDAPATFVIGVMMPSSRSR